MRPAAVDFLSFRLGSRVHKIAIPSTMGAAAVKLRGQNLGDETPDSALSESIGRKSCLTLRPDSKGIALRLGGRWPLLALSFECRSKSFARLTLLWRCCLGRSRAGIQTGFTSSDSVTAGGGGHYLTTPVQKTVCACGIFLSWVIQRV